MKLLYTIEGNELNNFKEHVNELKDCTRLILYVSKKLIDSTPKINAKIKDENPPFLIVELGKVRYSRAFIFIGKNKFISISYPIDVKYSKEAVKLYIRKIRREITNKHISECIGIINLMKGTETVLDAWMDDVHNNSEDTLWILDYLLRVEPGYIRYDCDPIHAKKSHPQDHLDVNVTKEAKYKIGLYNQLSYEDFISILDPDSDCMYLSNYVDSKGHKSNLWAKKKGNFKGRRKHKH